MRPTLPALMAFLVSGTAVCQAQTGLAAKYSGDKGIAGDPAVIFAEDFEAATVALIGQRYTERQNPDGMSLQNDVPVGSPGKTSLEMTSVSGTNEGGRLFRRLNPGLTGTVHFRYYIKHFSGGTYHHTGVGVGGFNPPLSYFQGLAGLKPTGSSNFSVSPEMSPPDKRFDLYTYWKDMRAWATPPTTYYGNTFVQDPNVKPPLDAWLCVEVMIKLNDPVTSANGELALWLDGKRITHLGPGFPKGRWVKDTWRPDSAGTPFEGFQWRDAAALDLNFLKIQHYVTADPAGYVGRVRFDHVVLAREYIGPLATGPSVAQPPGSRSAAPPAAVDRAPGRSYLTDGSRIAPSPGEDGPTSGRPRPGTRFPGPVFHLGND